MRPITVFVLALAVVVPVVRVRGAKILIMPNSQESGVNLLVTAGAALEEKGHDIRVFAHQNFASRIEKKGLKRISHQFGPFDIEEVDSKLWSDPRFDANPFTQFTMIAKIHFDILDDFLANPKSVKELVDEKFDMVIVDSFASAWFIIPHKFGLKYMAFSAAPIYSWNLGVPALPSVEPALGSLFTDQMSFHERVSNFVQTIVTQMLIPRTWLNADFVAKYVPDKPPKSIKELMQGAEIHLGHLDVIALGFSRVSAPYYRYISGITSTAPKPLNYEMQEIVDNAEHGFIVFSLGGHLRKIPGPVLAKLLDTFSDIKETVFVAYDGEIPENVPSNVHTSKWLPQNDLLAHEKAKLFITHGGANGQIEAVYHGVPMLNTPMFAEQHHNAIRAEEKGYSRRFNIRNFEAYQLKQLIREIIDNPSYKNKIQHASAIYHDLPKAIDEFTFWTEHVLKFGGCHLKSRAITMPWYQLFMFDILAAFLVVVLVLLLIIKKVLKMIIRKCAGKSKED